MVDKYYRYKYWRAHRAFKRAIPYRYYLPEEAFAAFVRQYGNIPAGPRQDYSISGMESLAAERFNFVNNKINFTPTSVLEIGPGAGFVLKKFKEKGIQKAVALDIVDGLYPEVKNAGVEILLSSADNMKCIPDKSYDLVLSWSALEHIPNPQLVFEECLRIVKPGGYIYLQFGPLYYSSWGYHHYSILNCPYLHLLFPEYLIHEYAKKMKEDNYEGYLPWTNGEATNAYDFIKKGLPYGYLLESLSSGFDYYSSHMIIRYPEIFKSKNVPFESFFIDGMHVGIYRKNS